MTVEKKLDTFFKLASNWEAVLLFDETDILLEAWSTQGDLTRNSWSRMSEIKNVNFWSSSSRFAVFLKVLEDYEGILIRTTNRKPF
jgi:hypothetical protein